MLKRYKVFLIAILVLLSFYGSAISQTTGDYLKTPVKTFRFNAREKSSIKISYDNTLLGVKEKSGLISSIINVYNIETGEKIASIDKNIVDFAFSPDGKKIAGVSTTDLFIYSLPDKKFLVESKKIKTGISKGIVWDWTSSKILISSYYDGKNITYVDLNGNEIWSKDFQFALKGKIDEFNNIDKKNKKAISISSSRENNNSVFFIIDLDNGNIIKKEESKNFIHSAMFINNNVYTNIFELNPTRWEIEAGKNYSERLMFDIAGEQFVISNRAVISVKNFEKFPIKGNVFLAGNYKKLFSFDEENGDFYIFNLPANAKIVGDESVESPVIVSTKNEAQKQEDTKKIEQMVSAETKTDVNASIKGDKTPPQLILVDPEISEGENVEHVLKSSETEVSVMAFILDDSPIKSVIVNNKNVELKDFSQSDIETLSDMGYNANGKWISIKIPVSEIQNNNLVLSAIDIANNESKIIITIKK